MISCPECTSINVIKDGRHNEYQRYRCNDCRKRFDFGLYMRTNEKFYIDYFGVKIKNMNLHINRDNYAIIDKRVYNKVTNSFILKYYEENPEEHDKIYDNKENTIYSDAWCEEHRKYCLENYDLNMNFFNSLNEDEFNRQLNKLLKKSKKIKQIYNLNDCKDVSGIYIMVLDKYKQVYIGQATKSIKKRIMAHWSTKKEFDRLLCGDVNKSILSIDSFGAYDTTRIYMYPTTIFSIDKVERELVESMHPNYILNRSVGGVSGNDSYSKLEIIAGIKKRNLNVDD